MELAFVYNRKVCHSLVDLTAVVLFCGHGLVVIFARRHHAYADEGDDHGEREEELFHFS